VSAAGEQALEEIRVRLLAAVLSEVA